ncbi:MFS transporter [Emcibacter sp. SYSU 3D8]|uniref:spinster family MFS transporter n=1 Tax=Emcibacter sp. SYSU 3D8 TaxID=3133969 RepID=UPI0031FEDFF2
MADLQASPDKAPYPRPILAWLVVGVLILAALIAYIDRQVVAIVVDQMKVDLGVGDAQIGWLYGVFAIFYAIAGLPIAWMSDRKSRKHIIAIGIFFWSLMTMACGLSKNFWMVFLARIGVGVGEATLTPATNSLIGDYFPRDKIPLALSIVQAGPIMGSGIAFIIGGYVYGIVEQAKPLTLPFFGALAPWQQTFLYVGAPGLIIAFLFLLIREPIRRTIARPAGSEAGTGSDVSLVNFYRRNARMVVFHHLGFLCFGLLGYAFVFWTVSYFVRVHGMNNADASQIFGWIFLLAGPLGPIFAAMYAARLTQRGKKDANIIAPLVGSLIGVAAVLTIQVMPNPFWAFVFYAPALIFVNSPFAMAYASLTYVTPPALRARVSAVYMFMVSFGMMLGPPIAGMFNEHIFPSDQGVRYSIMCVTLIFGFLGTIFLLLARKPYVRTAADADVWSGEESPIK